MKISAEELLTLLAHSMPAHEAGYTAGMLIRAENAEAKLAEVTAERDALLRQKTAVCGPDGHWRELLAEDVARVTRSPLFANWAQLEELLNNVPELLKDKARLDWLTEKYWQEFDGNMTRTRIDEEIAEASKP